MGRFRIRPEHVDDVLDAFRKTRSEPLQVYNRDDGAVAIEIGEMTDKQSKVFSAIFRPEWSAIIGIVGGDPFETKN